MAENKESFVLYRGYGEIFEALDDRDAGQLVKHLFRYVNDENPETKNALVNISFIPIKQQLKRDLIKWVAKQEQRKEAGRISAEKRRLIREQSLKISEKTIKNALTNVSDLSISSTVYGNGNGNGNGNVSSKDDVVKSIVDLKKDYLKDDQLITAVCENNNISPVNLKKMLTKFNKHLKENGVKVKPWLDYCSHFLSWLKKQKVEKKFTSNRD